MKTTTPPEVRRQVLALRRSHSLREVAEITGLPLSTVKTLCARSGVFGENQTLRALMTLPEPTHSASTALTIPGLPDQKAVTGDRDIDAMLWLREVVSTGDPGHIAKALEAAQCIKTPADDLERAYGDWLARNSPGGVMAAVFGSIGFANLEELASRILDKAAVRAEALARFGSDDDLFAPTPAERFCTDALAGLECTGPFSDYAPEEVAERFEARADLMPQTLADVLHELAYWRSLYGLRGPFGCGDDLPEVGARKDFLDGQMARIRPRNRAEALAVLEQLVERERLEDDEGIAILKNLIGAPQ